MLRNIIQDFGLSYVNGLHKWNPVYFIIFIGATKLKLQVITLRFINKRLVALRINAELFINYSLNPKKFRIAFIVI